MDHIGHHPNRPTEIFDDMLIVLRGYDIEAIYCRNLNQQLLDTFTKKMRNNFYRNTMTCFVNQIVTSILLKCDPLLII